MSDPRQLRAVRDAIAVAVEETTVDGRLHRVAYRARVDARDCLDVFDASPDPERFYWERPDRGIAIVGLGRAFAIEVDGGDRFDRVAQGAVDLFRTLHVAGEAGPKHAGPLLLGGFAFDAETPRGTTWRGFPAGRFTLPEVAFARDGDLVWCTLVRSIEAGEDPDTVAAEFEAAMRRHGKAPCARARRAPADSIADRVPGGAAAFTLHADRARSDFCAQVEDALAGIRAGDFEKVVLARTLRVAAETRLDTGRLLAGLRDAYPSCTLFAVAHDGAAFVGATPEHLVRLDGEWVETAAVAGSAPRSSDPQDDARKGRLLLESKKEQVEHAIVVRALRAALSDCCDPLDVPEAPRLLRVAEIQHLETPIRGRLLRRESILELVGRLHPTPAVGGSPRGAAMRFIAEREGFDRGWYAGPVGFVDPTGGGEFCVALRSALLRDREAHLFAGAGIVDRSIPEAELRETRLKFHAILQPLLDV